MVKFFWDVGGGIYKLKQYGFSSQIRNDLCVKPKRDALQYVLSYLEKETNKITQG
jgi:hypothetical protein